MGAPIVRYNGYRNLDRGVPPEPPGVQLKGWESADGRRHGSLLSRGPGAEGGASARAARRREPHSSETGYFLAPYF